jgi:alanyl-tRNA synthetase
VTDVQVFSGYVLHIGTVTEGALKVGDEVVAAFDELRRAPLRRNHTATHVLNYALREVLGDHIDQKGSLVAPTKLRFDFSHKQPITPDEMAKIEQLSREWIARDVPVYSAELPLETGFKIPGLRAVFGEAYPDPVRVVTLEYDVKEMAADPENPKWRQTSVEFCGGTCVSPFLIVVLHLIEADLVLRPSAMSTRRPRSGRLPSSSRRASPRAFVG